MTDLLAQALAPGVTLREFFMTHVPKLHERERPNLPKITREPLILSFWYEDLDERYTIMLSAQGCQVLDDELDDYPIITVVARGQLWEQTKPMLRDLGQQLDAGRDALTAQLKQPIARAHLEEFERKFQGVIRTRITDVQGLSEPLILDVVLNDYAPPSGHKPTFEVTLDAATLSQLATGQLRASEAGPRLKIAGQMALAMNLGGFLTTHFKP